MAADADAFSCQACGTISKSNYCPNCGQKRNVKRITLPELLHEVFHFFTHLDKGFPYTLKKLVAAPGQMQKAYISGTRARFQKPFSMFFISATASALIYYWVYRFLIQNGHTGNEKEMEFFNHYWVLFHVCLFPLYCLFTYLCFKKAGYNYGEVAVFQLYVFSALFLMLALLQTGKFFYPQLDTRYLELPLVLGYTLLTNLRFFSNLRRLPILLLSLLNIAVTFLLVGLVQDAVISLL
jgi:hypothetical protein